MAQAEFLRQRAEEFWENARENVKREHFSLAAFHFEQTCQLYLKYYLFRKLADFPRTHSIKKLLEAVGKAYERQPQIEELKKQEWNAINDLDEAYLISRYLPAEFDAKQVEQLAQFTKKLIDFLASL